MVNQLVKMHSFTNRTNPLFITHVTERMATFERATGFSISKFLLKHRLQIKRLDIPAHNFHALCLTKLNRRQFCLDCLYEAVAMYPRDLAIELQNMHIEGMLTSRAYFGRFDAGYGR